MNTVDYSHIVGVFRDRSHVDGAIAGLKWIGIGEDQIQVTEYNLQTVKEVFSSSRQESNQRLIVHVKADGKEQEAVGILVGNGANNADIPPGTELVGGSLISSNSETADLISSQPTDEGSSDGFFGKIERAKPF
jgi:hypothetical protein